MEELETSGVRISGIDITTLDELVNKCMFEAFKLLDEMEDYKIRVFNLSKTILALHEKNEPIYFQYCENVYSELKCFRRKLDHSEALFEKDVNSMNKELVENGKEQIPFLEVDEDEKKYCVGGRNIEL